MLCRSFLFMVTSIPSSYAVRHIRAVGGSVVNPLIARDTGRSLANSTTFTAVIRADSNRDGRVDVATMTDEMDKLTWNSTYGAIFLPNIGDETRRCAIKDAKGDALGNRELSACNDAADDTVIASAEYLAPLRTLPMKDLSDQAIGNVYVEDFSSNVRLFINASETWTYLYPDTVITPTYLREGLVLGIDSRQLVTDDAVWDGQVTVHFDVRDGSSVSSDSVVLKLAPVLIHHPLQQISTIVSTQATQSGSDNETTFTADPQATFLSDLEEGRKAAGIKSPLFLFNTTPDVWAQDFFEPAYSSMPGSEGPVTIRIMLRSPQPDRDGGRTVFEELRGKGVGAYSALKGAEGCTINSFGNLETIPPYTAPDGTEYPMGRVVIGKHFDIQPASSIMTFLNSQGMQNPLVLETGWLNVGHVDEFVQFLPFNNSLGWTISIAAPQMGIDLLKDIANRGLGSINASSAPPVVTCLLDRGVKTNCTETFDNRTVSVDSLLTNMRFLTANEEAQRFIDDNLAVLLGESGLDRSDVLEVPMIFEHARSDESSGNSSTPLLQPPPDTNSTESPTGFGGWRRPPPIMRCGARVSEETAEQYNGDRPDAVVSKLPAVVNGVVAGKTYISPNPWGPVVDGKDVFAQATVKHYAKAGMRVVFVNDFYSHHVGGGDVHCGTNTLRDTTAAWWK